MGIKYDSLELRDTTMMKLILFNGAIVHVQLL